MKTWNTAIATVSISGDLETKLQAISAAGFTGYELFEADLITSLLTPEDIRKISEDLNLKPYLYQPFRDVDAVSEEKFVKNLERAKHKFELMNRIGLDTILVCSNVSTATENNDDLVVEQLSRLGDVAEQFQVKVAYEALAWAKYINEYDHAWRIVEQVNHEFVGTCLDSFHIYSRATSLEAIKDIPGEKIFFLQLADAQTTALDILSWSRHHRLFPGEGEWDLATFMRKVLATGYDGPVSIEVFNDIFRQKDADITAIEAKRSLVLLQQTTEATPESAELLSVKTHQQPQKLDFLELQTSAPEKAKTILTQLGFRSTMVHKSRWAQVWTNNDINIVMRADSSGSSGIFRLIGFGVEMLDDNTVLDRAEAFHSPEVDGTEFFDEYFLTGLTSPSFEHIFLTDVERTSRLWDQEFIQKTDPQEHSSEVSYTGIDHLALVQPWEQLDETRLYYKNIFGLETATSQFLPESFGLVRSISLHNHSKQMRLVLNEMPNSFYFETSGTPRTAANHIAFTSKNLIADLHQLTQNGLELLTISQNYYEDLQARFQFTDEMLANLQELNILYDEDEHGKFFHAYTPPFGNVFFEIIQRIDDYDGYGAANAPVRMAAARNYSPKKA